ncbi:copper ion binding protein [Evansella cellulosilytica]|uniref:Copper chaperone CopZ n=1 Tax=Evansella cellulosilytica (strain ATCC 21833 / DSM 2522 / FERM P-1141 / JCM 9156 / N-4) TaxID=649639 RepID=E6TYW4_EVAC2|nr:copper ion binding protein [Evansella cellulosilytica]ADU31299.1 copper ion binding protein [Evansella cellulosilytica DSM 2522]
MKKVNIAVVGMSCGHCVSTIEGALSKLDGVSKVEVNLKENKVLVELDISKVRVLQIEQAIEELGYSIACH